MTINTEDIQDYINAERSLAGLEPVVFQPNVDRRFVVEKSLGFGRRVRELEDHGYFQERLRVRKMWKDFSNRAIDKKFRLAAIDAYYDEFCREPTDEEYDEVERELRERFGDPDPPQNPAGSEDDKAGG